MEAPCSEGCIKPVEELVISKQRNRAAVRCLSGNSLPVEVPARAGEKIALSEKVEAPCETAGDILNTLPHTLPYLEAACHRLPVLPPA